MKYPQAGDLQRKLSTQLSNPAQKNPYEVRSPSGLEGVFFNEGDAEFHADELRRSGVSGVRVERRERQRGGMARAVQGNPIKSWDPAFATDDEWRTAHRASMENPAGVHGKHNPGWASSIRKHAYTVRVGSALRDHLVEEIDTIDWDGDDDDGVPFADRARRVKAALVKASPQGNAYGIDAEDFSHGDYEFLSNILEDGVVRNMKNMASSRGISSGAMSRQIREFRESIMHVRLDENNRRY